MAQTFHSMKSAQILGLLNSSGLVASDLYYATDTQQLYVACTNQDSTVGIAETGMILTGDIELGFNGAVGAQGEQGEQGEQGIQGPPGTGSLEVVGVYTSSSNVPITVTAAFANSSSAITLTIVTASLTTGQVTNVKNIGLGVCSVVGASGNIDGQSASVDLLTDDSISLLWDGTNFWLQ